MTLVVVLVMEVVVVVALVMLVVVVVVVVIVVVVVVVVVMVVVVVLLLWLWWYYIEVRVTQSLQRIAICLFLYFSVVVCCIVEDGTNSFSGVGGEFLESCDCSEWVKVVM